MKQATLKTFGAVVLGAAAVSAGAGTASATTAPGPDIDGVTSTLTGALGSQSQQTDRAAEAVKGAANSGGNKGLLGGLPVGDALPTGNVTGGAPGGLLG